MWTLKRLLWVRVFGIPNHVWCSAFFQKLGNSLGFFISVDGGDLEGGRMDVVCICVRVPLDFVRSNHMAAVIDGGSSY